MAEIIRQRAIPSINRLNKWPSNGMFTCPRLTFEHIERRWFHIAIQDFPLLVGNAFEQTEFNMITFNIAARRNYSNNKAIVIDVSIDKVSIDVMPIESEEFHSIEDYLTKKITSILYSYDYAEFQITCYVKGWFWL